MVKNIHLKTELHSNPQLSRESDINIAHNGQGST